MFQEAWCGGVGQRTPCPAQPVSAVRINYDATVAIYRDSGNRCIVNVAEGHLLLAYAFVVYKNCWQNVMVALRLFPTGLEGEGGTFADALQAPVGRLVCASLAFMRRCLLERETRAERVAEK